MPMTVTLKIGRLALVFLAMVTGFMIFPKRFASDDDPYISNDINHMFDCSNVGDISIKEKIGEGLSKEVFKGTYKGTHIAVKAISPEVGAISRCLNHLQPEEDTLQCFIFHSMRFMKEILILQQLKHPNIAQLLGYCVRSNNYGADFEVKINPKTHGMVSLHEYGVAVKPDTILAWPQRRKLELVKQLVDLLIYFDKSPLGSLLVPEIAEKHIVLIKQRVKLIDFEDVTSEEPPCAESPQCKYSIECQEGFCKGFNAKENLDNMHELILKDLLLRSKNKDLIHLSGRIERMEVNADDIGHFIQNHPLFKGI